MARYPSPPAVKPPAGYWESDEGKAYLEKRKTENIIEDDVKRQVRRNESSGIFPFLFGYWFGS